jgi:glycosyltransferase involved in cell wall biosynthesis
MNNPQSEILFSILTPAVPSRFAQLETLTKMIADQIGNDPVEHLILLDNKRRTVGEKRDNLLRAARGRYIAFVDDDDMISRDYVSLILDKIRKDPDVITFSQQATVNGQTGIVEFKLGNENEQFNGSATVSVAPDKRDACPTIKRNAWHVCAWRRMLAIQSHFPSINYGEDWAFAKPLCDLAQTSEHIPKVLHFYRHSSAATEAPAQSNAHSTSTSFSPPDVFRLATGR